MSRAFFTSTSPIAYLTLFIGLLTLLFWAPQAWANISPTFTKLQVELGLETGDGDYAFDDANTTVERGRFMKYQIKVENTGNFTMENVHILMEPPDYMTYVPNSSFLIYSNDLNEIQLPDAEPGISALALGYKIESLPPQKVAIFTIQYQVFIEMDDPAYTLAWAHGWSPYTLIFHSPNIKSVKNSLVAV